ncbi:MAG TPA: NAD-glutamate dehydrogenase [Micropepsaceae bacterium]|nr:NAD-glutamate dehydrogenase [Micropepsaceae bacterium]
MARTSRMIETAQGTAPEEANLDAAEAAAHLAVSARLIGTGDSELAAFFTGFTRYASPEDLIHYTGAELAALVKLVFARTARRVRGASLVEIFAPGSEDPEFTRNETIIVAVNDDIPFLYDSCIAEIRAQGFRIATAFHPVIAAARDEGGARNAKGAPLKESVMVLALDGEVDKALAEELRAGLLKVFGDVRAVVRDWKPMLARLAETTAGLKRNPPPVPAEELAENIAFLDWLAAAHFTFLGCRDYVFSPDGEGRLDPDLASGLGLLTDPEMRIVRRGADRSSLTPDVRDFLTRPAPLIIAKSALRSSVHRRVHMDYVGVKIFDAKGQLIGERRFVGLFTSTAYSQLPAEIPLLRRKTARVLAGSGLPPASHDGKALQHILDTFPRDELFQISENELLATGLGILNLGERPKVRVFLRFDRFDRYVSALVYVPRERYSGAVREKIHGILARTFDGRKSAATPMLDDEALARVHYIIGRNPGVRPEADVKELESEIRAAIRNWDDGLADAMRLEYGETTSRLALRYANAFPAGYRERFTPEEAVEDIGRIDAVLKGHGAGGTLAAHAYGHLDDTVDALRLKLFVHGGFVPLSECLPVFENLGLKVIAEDAFALNPFGEDGEPEEIALQNILMARADGEAVEIERLKLLLEDAFHAVWADRAESDGFNKLVVVAELPWRDITILRGVAKFLRQAGLTLSPAYMENALVRNPAIAVLLVSLFRNAHDPDRLGDSAARARAMDHIREQIAAALDGVPSADDDRIIRAMQSVIDAMLRASFFQTDADGNPKPYFVFKLDSRRLDMLPAPKPLYEMFLYSPEVEGVHLRFGKIARGGIRWSDRAEDFRTEVLSLAKAQQVKNAVIVPVGAKGGFYPKRIPAGASREVAQATGIAAYKTFVGALLDLTDNIGPDGKVIPPPHVIRYDDDDPYLVVAADKGTATFSDIANEIALARGFWLGDAFASGGSQGYDHKKIGITARGAWEAVKRHFRELNRDIQAEAFTCVGVGDMSGDVFGNAMLCSQETKLLAAFDHRHIFVDPSPEPHAAWAERKRLFDLPRSSWADYDATMISKGGGIFPRTAKEIVLSDEMKRLSGIAKDRIAPAEFIRALLSAEVDLLFFGGIGTFIKSSTQSHADAGDRTNDSLRVNGRDVKALIVGEGANVGVTQLGRIEYAREGGPEAKGGRIDTDAIDNSAGVDTSDHEVNIKILMSGPLRRGELSAAERLSTLTAMTEDVARLVLKNNYDQTLALSVAESTAARDLDASARFMRELERKAALDRDVEYLPSDEAIRSHARANQGLSRPELAVLLAYAKLDLSHAIEQSELAGDPHFDALLTDYFPPLAAQRFASEVKKHRLAREIVATELANKTVNLAGPLFSHRMRELSNAPLWCAARAFALAEGVFDLSGLKARICALDLKIPAQTQNAMMADIAELLRRIGLWFIVQMPTGDMNETVRTYGAGFAALKGRFSTLVSPLEAEAAETRIAALQKAGVPLDVAEDAAVLPLLGAVPEIVLLAQTRGVSAADAARVYFAMGALVGLDRLRVLAGRIVTADHWDRLALRRITDDLYSAQRLLAGDALLHAARLPAGTDAVDAWAELRHQEIERTASFLSELAEGGDASIAKLALANSQVQKLATTSEP